MATKEISEAARLLGSIRSARKAVTSAENGKAGGRPRTVQNPAPQPAPEPVQESRTILPAILEHGKAGA